MNTALDHGIVREVGRGEMASHLVHSLCRKKYILLLFITPVRPVLLMQINEKVKQVDVLHKNVTHIVNCPLLLLLLLLLWI